MTSIGYIVTTGDSIKSLTRHIDWTEAEALDHARAVATGEFVDPIEFDITTASGATHVVLRPSVVTHMTVRAD